MCRMLTIIGLSSYISRLRGPLLDSLVKASRRDPYAEKLFKKNVFSHGDGWGRIAVGFDRDGLYRLSIYKSLKPIYLDSYTSVFEDGDLNDLLVMADLIHARASSKNMKVNIYSTHPAEAVTRSGYKLYIIHNGTVNKDLLVENLSLNKDSEYVEKYNDTHFLAQYLAERDIKSIDRSVITDIKRFVKTALNIGLVLVRDNDILIAIGSYYIDPDNSVEKFNYYKIYRAYRDDLYVYASSTLIDHYKPNIDLKWNVIENGRFDIYRISPNTSSPVSFLDSFTIA